MKVKYLMDFFISCFYLCFDNLAFLSSLERSEQDSMPPTHKRKLKLKGNTA